MKRKKIKLLAIVLTLVLSIVGCNKISSDDEKEIVNENNIQQSDYIHLTMLYPETINPILNRDKSVSYIMNLIYDGLFEIDEDYNVKPVLVETYKESSDGKSINIKLVDNAKWHDGSSVTSSDVNFTISLIKDNKTSPYYELVKDIKSVKITDSKNFIVEYSENDPFRVDKLIFPIVSKDKLQGLKSNELLQKNKNFVGNGPYKIKQYIERQHLVLESNEEYFGDLPKDRKDIFVKVVPDVESQTEMVLSLDSDVADISVGELSKFEDKKEFNITNYQGREYELAMFNYKNDFLQNADIRKAIASVVDRQKIFKEAYVDNGTEANFPLNNTSKYYDSNIKSLPIDKEKAKSYLVKGLAKVSKKLKLENPEELSEEDEKNQTIIEDNNINGSASVGLSKKEMRKILAEINFKIIVSKDNEGRVKVANIIKEEMQTIGIKSTIVELDDKAMTKALDTKDYDIALIGFSLSSVPDARGILNSLQIEDKKLETYITDLNNAKTQEQTKEIYSQMQEHIIKNASFISVGVLDHFIVKNKRLEGSIHPNEFDIYQGISNLQMEK